MCKFINFNILLIRKQHFFLLFQLARSKNLFIMEAMWMFFTPAFTILREEINKGTIGEPLQIISSFGTPMSESLIQQ